MHQVRKNLAMLLVILVVIMSVGQIFADTQTTGDSKVKDKFNDIKGHWAHDVLQSHGEMGLLSGYPDGSFLPDNTMKRSELITMTNSYFGLIKESEFNFEGVSKDDWYSKQTAIAKFYDYIEEGNLNPEADATRKDVVDMITALIDVGLVDEDSSQMETFVKLGYMTGYEDGTLRPNDPVKRAEVIKIADNTLGYIVRTQEGADTIPEGVEKVTVISPNIKIKNKQISGDLYISPGVSGGVSVTDTDVGGRVIISGGSDKKNPIVLKGVKTPEVLITKAQESLNLNMEDSEVGNVVAKTETNIGMVNTKVEKLDIKAPTNFIADKKSVVDKLNADAKSTFSGEGQIKEADVNVEGVVMDKAPDKVKLAEKVESVSVDDRDIESDDINSNTHVIKPPSSGGGGGGGSSSKPTVVVPVVDPVIAVMENYKVENGEIVFLLDVNPTPAPSLADFDGTTLQINDVDVDIENLSISYGEEDELVGLIKFDKIEQSDIRQNCKITIVYKGDEAPKPSWFSLDALGDPELVITKLTPEGLEFEITGTHEGVIYLEDFDELKYGIGSTEVAEMTFKTSYWYGSGEQKGTMDFTTHIDQTGEDQIFLVRIVAGTLSDEMYITIPAVVVPVIAVMENSRASNGEITFRLDVDPVPAPSISDFDATVLQINGTIVDMVNLDISYDAEAFEGVITFDEIEQSDVRQDCVLTVAYRGDYASKPSGFNLDALGDPEFVITELTSEGFDFEITGTHEGIVNIGDFTKINYGIADVPNVPVTDISIDVRGYNYDSGDQEGSFEFDRAFGATENDQTLLVSLELWGTSSDEMSITIPALVAPAIELSNMTNGSVDFKFTGDFTEEVNKAAFSSSTWGVDTGTAPYILNIKTDGFVYDGESMEGSFLFNPISETASDRMYLLEINIGSLSEQISVVVPALVAPTMKLSNLASTTVDFTITGDYTSNLTSTDFSASKFAIDSTDTATTPLNIQGFVYNSTTKVGSVGFSAIALTSEDQILLVELTADGMTDQIYITIPAEVPSVESVDVTTSTFTVHLSNMDYKDSLVFDFAGTSVTIRDDRANALSGPSVIFDSYDEDAKTVLFTFEDETAVGGVRIEVKVEYRGEVSNWVGDFLAR